MSRSPELFQRFSSAIPRAGDGRAFTLIEILIVVAILAILAAILLPVVGRMRDAALTAASTSNLRQIHLIMQTYLQDHQGDFPISVDQSPKSPPVGYEVTWRRVIWENAYGPFTGNAMDAMKNSAYAKTMWCPLMVKRHGQLQHPAGQGSYSLNRFFMPPAWGGGIRRINRSDVIGRKEPYIMAGTPLSNNPRIGTFYHLDSARFPYETAWSSLNYAYGSSGDQALGLFIDGHVESIPKKQGVALHALLNDRTSLE